MIRFCLLKYKKLHKNVQILLTNKLISPSLRKLNPLFFSECRPQKRSTFLSFFRKSSLHSHRRLRLNLVVVFLLSSSCALSAFCKFAMYSSSFCWSRLGGPKSALPNDRFCTRAVSMSVSAGMVMPRRKPGFMMFFRPCFLKPLIMSLRIPSSSPRSPSFPYK